MKSKSLQILVILLLLSSTSLALGREYIIFSIAQEIPMGHENEVIKKNYYVNMGIKQGLEKGTILDVYRTISRLDPYQTKKRHLYEVKIGQLKVVHTEDHSAITSLEKFDEDERSSMLEIEALMVGDHVKVNVE